MGISQILYSVTVSLCINKLNQLIMYQLSTYNISQISNGGTTSAFYNSYKLLISLVSIHAWSNINHCTIFNLICCHGGVLASQGFILDKYSLIWTVLRISQGCKQ